MPHPGSEHVPGSAARQANHPADAADREPAEGDCRPGGIAAEENRGAGDQAPGTAGRLLGQPPRGAGHASESGRPPEGISPGCRNPTGAGTHGGGAEAAGAFSDRDTQGAACPRADHAELGDELADPREDEDADIEYAKSQVRHGIAQYNSILDRIEGARLEAESAEAAFKYRYRSSAASETARYRSSQSPPRSFLRASWPAWSWGSSERR